MLSEKQGEFLVKSARKIAENYIKGRREKYDFSEPWLSENLGVFTTIETYPKHNLRGCIGFPLPHLKLGMALIEASKSACRDPRFANLAEKELDNVVFEVSVLSKPEEIKFKSTQDLLKKIILGKDGVILEYGNYSGLFLPQVWKKLPEKNEFLDNLCIKAGLPPGSWKMSGVHFYKFNAQVFTEEKPKGKIKEVNQ